MRYETVYIFEIIDKLKDGKDVFIFDKADRSVTRVKNMEVEELIGILHYDNKNNRLEAYIEEKETKVKGGEDE